MGRVGMIVALLALLQACKPRAVEKATTVTSWSLSFEDPSIPTRVKDGSGDGTYFTRCDAKNPYGAGLSYEIPDSLKGFFMRVCVDFDARPGLKNFGQSLVVTVQKKDSMLLWGTFEVNDHTYRHDKWIHISDSMQFFYAPPGEGIRLNLFGFNAHPEARLDIDNLKVTLRKAIHYQGQN